MKHGGKSVSVAVMALLFGLSVSIVLSGCSGGGGGSPTTPDEGMANSPDTLINRQAQDFNDIYEWGSAWTLDNASSTWVLPVTYCYNGPQPGTLAVKDYYSENGFVSPLVTATAKVETDAGTDVIKVRVDDLDSMGSTPDREETIYAPYNLTGTNEVLCKHPAVEVAYFRYAQNFGAIVVYTVWSQLSEEDSEENWDLYANCLVFRVFAAYGGGINTTPVANVTIALEETKSTYYHGGDPVPGDELQPDLALMPNGDLLITYIKTDSSLFNESSIMAMRLDYDPADPFAGLEQMGAYGIAEPSPGVLPTPRNIAPSVDVGVVISIDADYDYTAFCAWFNEVVNSPQDPLGYEILYAYWDALSDSYGGSPTALTSGSSEANALVNVDIAPAMHFGNTSVEEDPYREVVLAWTNFDYSVYEGDLGWVQTYSNPAIQLMVAPTGDQAFYEIPNTYGIAPDLACYEHTYGGDQWFGVSFYEADTGGGMGSWAWDGTRINSYMFDDDYAITFEESTPIDIEPAFWWIGVPFAGSALCLRNPSVPDDGDPSEPIYDLFGIAKVQGDSYQTTAYVGEGIIFEE